MTLNLLDCVVMNGKTGRHDSSGPIQFRYHSRRLGVFPDDQIFYSHQGSGNAEFDGGGLPFEPAVRTGEERIQFAHTVGTGGIESLAPD